MEKLKNIKNPWPGVMSYQIPREGEDQYKFCGRSRTAESFVPLIRRYSLTTLYGRSGVGKTSFLNAGVFPMLQQEGYLPVYVRLGLKQLKDEKTFAQTIVERLTEETDTYSVVEYDWQDKQSAAETDYLWKYFHTHRFKAIDSEGDFQTPVIILDQAEEIFNYGEKSVSLLLKQLHELVSDNLILPSQSGWFQDTTCRFVISLREDFLFYLEDYIDKYDLQVLKENRFRLRPLSKSKAMEVVLEPGGEYINQEEREKVAELVVQAALQEDGEVNSLMLSLICHQLFERLQAEQKSSITAAMAAEVDTSIQDYYKEAIGGLPLYEREFIENYLIRDERRRRIDYKDFVDNVPDGKYLLGDDVKPNFGEQWSNTAGKKYKLVNRLQDNGDEGQVEIVHDQFARVISILKKELELEREKQKREKRRELWRQIGIGVAVLLVMILTAIPLSKNVQEDRLSIEEKVEKGVIDTIFSAIDIEDEEVVLGNTWVKNYAFLKHPYIKKLKVMDNTVLGYECFSECKNLEEVEFDGENIYVDFHCFDYCDNLKKIVIRRNTNFIHFESLGRLENLKEIEVEDGCTCCHVAPTKDAVLVIYMENNEANATLIKSSASRDFIPREWIDRFNLTNCKPCETVTAEELRKKNAEDEMYYYLIDENVESIDGIDKSLLSRVVYANLPKLKKIKTKLFYEKHKAAYSLLEFYAESLKEIDDSAFLSCGYLRKIVCPKVETLGNRPFLYNRGEGKLQVEMPNVKYAGEYAFRDVDLGTHISLDSLTEVSDNMLPTYNIDWLCLPKVKKVNYSGFAYTSIDTLILNQDLDLNNLQSCSNYELVGYTTDSMCIYVNKPKYRFSIAECEKLNFNEYSSVKEIYVSSDYDGDISLDYNRLPNLEKIDCDRNNERYFAHYNTLWEEDGSNYECRLIARNTSNLIVSTSKYLEVGDSVRKIVLLRKESYILLSIDDKIRNNIVLYLPYGSKKYAAKLSETTNFKDVREMSWLRTMWYNFDLKLAIHCHYNKAIPVGLAIVLLIFATLPLYYKKRKLRGKDLVLYIVSYLLIVFVGSFVIIASPFMDEKFSSTLYLYVYLLMWLSSIVAYWIAKRNYSFVEILRDTLMFLTTFSGCVLLVSGIVNDELSFRMIIVWSVICVCALVGWIMISRKIKEEPAQLTQNKMQDMSVRYLQMRKVMYVIMAVLMLVWAVMVSAILEEEGGYWWMLSLVCLVVPIWTTINHRRVEKHLEFDYGAYVMRIKKHEYDVKFLSGSMCKRRQKIVAISLAILYFVWYISILR